MAASSGSTSASRPISSSQRNPNEGRFDFKNSFLNSFSIRSRETSEIAIDAHRSLSALSGCISKRPINCITLKNRNGSSKNSLVSGARKMPFFKSANPLNGSSNSLLSILMPSALMVKSLRRNADSTSINGSIFTFGFLPGSSTRGTDQSTSSLCKRSTPNCLPTKLTGPNCLSTSSSFCNERPWTSISKSFTGKPNIRSRTAPPTSSVVPPCASIAWAISLTNGYFLKSACNFFASLGFNFL